MFEKVTVSAVKVALVLIYTAPPPVPEQELPLNVVPVASSVPVSLAPP